jgi:hypothetical protein
MQRLAGIITESQYEDLTYEPEDMDNPDEDLVIIGSGYLDIENEFRERPSQTNSEYAEIGQWVVDNLKTITKDPKQNNGDIEAALDYIYSNINESNTNESQLDEGETWIDGIWGTGNYNELIHKIENIFQEGGNGASFKCFGKDFTITKTKEGRFLITNFLENFGFRALTVKSAFIAAKKFAGITNESQLDEGETENPNSIKVNAKVNNKETKVSIDQDNFPKNVTIKWEKDRDANRPDRSKQDDELGSSSDYAKYWLEDHAEDLEFEPEALLDDYGNEGKEMLFTATSRDKMWEFAVEVQVPYNYEDSGNINDIDWRTLEITSKNEMEQLTKQKNKTMTLKELQKMIKEEFNAYMGEAEDDVEVSVSDNDVDAEMGDEMAPAGDEDVLRKIYDLLDAHFNGGEEAEEAPEEEAPADDVEGEEEESDLDENSTTDAKFQKTGMAPMSKGSAGPNVGYGTVGGKGSTGYDASSKALQERFQKLANIIK